MVRDGVQTVGANANYLGGAKGCDVRARTVLMGLGGGAQMIGASNIQVVGIASGAGGDGEFSTVPLL